jgi:hypothetical protein
MHVCEIKSFARLPENMHQHKKRMSKAKICDALVGCVGIFVDATHNNCVNGMKEEFIFECAFEVVTQWSMDVGCFE